MRRPCDQCSGTDCAQYCAQGQCYAEEQQRQQAEWEAEEQRRFDEWHQQQIQEGHE